MALNRFNGTTEVTQGKFFRTNGTNDVRIGKMYRSDGATDSLICSSELVIYNNGEKLRNWDISKFESNCSAKDSDGRISLAAWNGCTALVGWLIDVTGYDTLTFIASGTYKVAVTPHSPTSYPSNPCWNGSAYAGVSSTSGTIDVSSMSGEHYISIGSTSPTGNQSYSNGYLYKLILT